MDDELSLYRSWNRKYYKKKLIGINKTYCRCCSMSIPIGYLYCFKCQEDIDNLTEEHLDS